MHLALIVLKQFAKDLGGGDELWRRELLAADHQHRTRKPSGCALAGSSAVRFAVTSRKPSTAKSFA
jgi:hypothetical protein